MHALYKKNQIIDQRSCLQCAIRVTVELILSAQQIKCFNKEDE